jgi:hypothetical protein
MQQEKKDEKKVYNKTDARGTLYEQTRANGERHVQLVYGDYTTVPLDKLGSTTEAALLLIKEREANQIPLGFVRMLPPTEEHPNGRTDTYMHRQLDFENPTLFPDTMMLYGSKENLVFGASATAAGKI